MLKVLMRKSMQKQFNKKKLIPEKHFLMQMKNDFDIDEKINK